MRETIRQLVLALALPFAVANVWAVRGDLGAGPSSETARAYVAELAELPLPAGQRLRPPVETGDWRSVARLPEEEVGRTRRAALPAPPPPLPVAPAPDARAGHVRDAAPAPRAGEAPVFAVSPAPVRIPAELLPPDATPVRVATRAVPAPAAAKPSEPAKQAAAGEGLETVARAPEVAASAAAAPVPAAARPGVTKPAAPVAAVPRVTPLPSPVKNEPLPAPVAGKPLPAPREASQPGTRPPGLRDHEPAAQRPLVHATELRDVEPAPQLPVVARLDPSPARENLDLGLQPEAPPFPLPLPPARETVLSPLDPSPPPGLERLAAQTSQGVAMDFSLPEEDLPLFALAPTPQPIPEPASALLLGAALAAVAAGRRYLRRR